MTQDEFMELMQVRINIAEEKRREKEFYARGVEAMRLSKGLDASDFSVGNNAHIAELVISKKGY